MKNIVGVLLIVALAACTKTEETPLPADTAPATTTTAASTATAEKTYPMNGVLVSRDPAKNSVNIDNEDVPGVMAPMKMDYELRGAKVDSLPPDGSKVTMTLHEQNGTFWVSNVNPRQ